LQIWEIGCPPSPQVVVVQHYRCLGIVPHVSMQHAPAPPRSGKLTSQVPGQGSVGGSVPAGATGATGERPLWFLFGRWRFPTPFSR
jgi:hypothetical protein